MIQFSKGTLEPLNGKIIDDWYYWKYEELEQKAKNGMRHILRSQQ
ncbi:hypothetical protein AALJ42_09795 [Staphylococcus xylosus]